ncbi:hypothetical protein ABZ135_20030 [Streptomyces sp. NPDC006339]|uniref:hypothetical protein n=1 Tax=Streptomyces sp. NPDC006339 TaxID=3156755 RepID=UPI0033BDCC9D
MGRKQQRKMLRLMESGEPVRLAVTMATMKKLTRLAFIAQQFGYAYENLQQTSQGGSVLSLVPDPDPQARALAEENRERYPHAAEGGSLPPLVPEALEILKARMVLDLQRQHSTKARMVLILVPLTLGSLTLGLEFGEDVASVLTVAGGFWAATTALLCVLFAASRRSIARCTARLQAAGFTTVTDHNGQDRYVPPGGRLPGYGNPFAS